MPRMPSRTAWLPGYGILYASVSLPLLTYIKRRYRITHLSSYIYSTSIIWICYAIMQVIGDSFSKTRPYTQIISGIITQLRLNYKVAEYGAPIALLSQSKRREIIDTTAGRALSDTLKAIAHELGHGWTTWAEPEEDLNILLVFIGWEDNPSPALASSAAYQRLDSISALSAFTPHLYSPPEISLIPLSELIKMPLVNPSLGSASLEMVTWTFPPHLDPTSHAEHAATFERTDWRLLVDFAPLPSGRKAN